MRKRTPIEKTCVSVVISSPVHHSRFTLLCCRTGNASLTVAVKPFTVSFGSHLHRPKKWPWQRMIRKLIGSFVNSPTMSQSFWRFWQVQHAAPRSSSSRKRLSNLNCWYMKFQIRKVIYLKSSWIKLSSYGYLWFWNLFVIVRSNRRHLFLRTLTRRPLLKQATDHRLQ